MDECCALLFGEGRRLCVYIVGKENASSSYLLTGVRTYVVTSLRSVSRQEGHHWVSVNIYSTSSSSLAIPSPSVLRSQLLLLDIQRTDGPPPWTTVHAPCVHPAVHHCPNPGV